LKRKEPGFFAEFLIYAKSLMMRGGEKPLAALNRSLA
jgi:hypothetical protein